MPKPNKEFKVSSKDAALFTFEPWTYAFHDGRWELEAYSVASGQREIIAHLSPGLSGFAPEEVAEFIVRAVNTHAKREHLLNEMMAALEICLECEGLDWAAEHDAEIALRRAKAKG